MKHRSFIIKLFISLSLIISFTAHTQSLEIYASQKSVSVTCFILEDKEFGGVKVDISCKKMMSCGFKYGDACNIVFSNGYQLVGVPFFSGYYGKTQQAILLNYQGQSYIMIQRCQGSSVWKEAKCKEGDTVTITLDQSQQYLKYENAMHMTYSNKREDYESDEAFANFRVMKGGNLAKNRFYRGASAVNNQNNRASIVDDLLKEHKIQFILDLADTTQRLEDYQNTEGFSSPYFMSLYNQNKVALLGLGAGYRSDDYRKKVVDGLKELLENEGPYYIHCTEGKDRTGFVCILIECVAGYSLDELEADYMKTYENYYGITKDKEEQYNAIMEQKFNDMMYWLTDTDSSDTLKKADLEAGAKKYLLDSGMTKKEYKQLKALVMGKD